MALKISKTPKAPEATITKDQLEKSEETQKLEPTKTEQVTEQVGGAPTNLSKEAEAWCQVGFEASYTHNLGNYCSTRIGVTLIVPCLHSEINKVYDFSQSWVNERMEKLVEEINQ